MQMRKNKGTQELRFYSHLEVWREEGDESSGGQNQAALIKNFALCRYRSMLVCKVTKTVIRFFG